MTGKRVESSVRARLAGIVISTSKDRRARRGAGLDRAATGSLVARRISASPPIGSGETTPARLLSIPRRAEDEGIGHQRRTTALRHRELQAANPGDHAVLHRSVVHGGVVHRGEGDAALRVDLEAHGDASRQLRVPHQLVLVAVLELAVVGLDHAADELAVDGSGDGNRGGIDADLGAPLLAHATDARAEAGGATAAAAGSDRADGDRLTDGATAGPGPP